MSLLKRQKRASATHQRHQRDKTKWNPTALPSFPFLFSLPLVFLALWATGFFLPWLYFPPDSWAGAALAHLSFFLFFILSSVRFPPYIEKGTLAPPQKLSRNFFFFFFFHPLVDKNPLLLSIQTYFCHTVAASGRYIFFVMAAAVKLFC